MIGGIVHFYCNRGIICRMKGGLVNKSKKAIIEVQGTAVTILNQAKDDYISLTDIAKHKEPNRSDHVIQN